METIKRKSLTKFLKQRTLRYGIGCKSYEILEKAIQYSHIKTLISNKTHSEFVITRARFANDCFLQTTRVTYCPFVWMWHSRTLNIQVS